MTTTISFSASHAPGEEVGDVVMAMIARSDNFAEAAGLSPGMAARLTITVEELVANAIEHGSAGEITLALVDYPERIGLILHDNGVEFDPREKPLHDLPDPETGGGVGLSLVKAWSQIDDYARDGDRNRLSLNLPKER